VGPAAPFFACSFNFLVQLRTRFSSCLIRVCCIFTSSLSFDSAFCFVLETPLEVLGLVVALAFVLVVVFAFDFTFALVAALVVFIGTALLLVAVFDLVVLALVAVLDFAFVAVFSLVILALVAVLGFAFVLAAVFSF